MGWGKRGGLDGCWIHQCVGGRYAVRSDSRSAQAVDLGIPSAGARGLGSAAEQQTWEPESAAEVLFCMKQSKAQTLHYNVKRQIRSDQLPYYDWQVTDGQGWTLLSGTVFWDESAAIERARGALTALSKNPWRQRELLH